MEYSPFDDPELVAAFERHGVVHRPGMAEDMLDELGPLLVAEGIDLDDPDLSIDDLNAALARATEQRNLKNFTPVGDYRTWSLAALRAIGIALEQDSDEAVAILDTIGPEETSERPAASHLIGAALGLADTWFTDPALTRALSATRIPAWHRKEARQAATDILALARKHRSFDSVGRLIIRHAGLAVAEGGVLVIAGALASIARFESSDVATVSARLLTTEELTPLRSSGTARSGSGSAFGALAGPQTPRLSSADHALVSCFESWLEQQPDIAAPSVDHEINYFSNLVSIAREDSLDFNDPSDVIRFIGAWFSPDSDEVDVQGINTALTLEDYVGFRVETSSNRSKWQSVHMLIESVLDDLFDESDELSLEEPGVLREIIEESTSIAPEQLAAGLAELRPISAIPELLAWVGARHPVTQTGVVRRKEIAEVAALIGVSAVGVAHNPRIEFDADPEDATVYAASMRDVPALSSWWDALTSARVIETNTSSVKPGPRAEGWGTEDELPIHTAEQLAAEFAANLMTARIRAQRSGWYAEMFEIGIVAVTSARLTQALAADTLEVPEYFDDLYTEIAVAGSQRLLRQLQAFGYLTLDNDTDEVTVSPALRRVIARALVAALDRSRSALDASEEDFAPE